MKKLILLLCACLSFVSKAVTFDVDGLRYEILSQEDQTVELAIKPKSISYPTYSTYSGDITIPSEVVFNGRAYKVVAIGNHAFSNCYSLGEISIPQSVESIGFGSFSYSNISEIVLPGNLKSIGAAAFRDSDIKEIIIPESVKEIESTVFANCRNLQKVQILTNQIDGIPDNTFDSCSSLKEVNIPSSVKYLGRHAFALTRSLERLEIPSSCTEIGSYCFYYSGLTYIEIPDGVTELKGEMFANCSNLEVVDLPQTLSNFDKKAFYGCSKLKAINIPNGITEISSECFSYCISLSEVVFPNTLKRINSKAFLNCSSLKRICIPEGTTLVDSEAFYGCYISELSLPSTLQKVGGWAFGISELQELILPEALTEIGSYAFDDCVIRKVLCMSLIPINCEENVFNNDTYIYGTLNVPEGCLALYKEAKPWNSFFNIVEYENSSIENVMQGNCDYIIDGNKIIFDDNCHITVYDMKGNQIGYSVSGCFIFPQKGIYIICIPNIKPFKVCI